MSTRPRVDLLNISFFDWSGDRVIAGGAERYVRDLAILFKSMGLEARIIQNASAPFTRTHEGIEVHGIAASQDIDFERLSESFAPLVTDAALVIASPVELACRIPDGIPVIGINHGIWWDDPDAPVGASEQRHRILLDAIARAMSTVCVDTNFINWIRASRHDASSLVYVPNYAALDRFAGVSKSFDGPLRVLFARRLCRERGVPELIEAFGRVIERTRDVFLDVCGSGSPPDEEAVGRFVQAYPDRITWTRRSPDEMPEAYARSHVVLIPSRYAEGTSLACIEGMASNNAVIATNVGGLTNLVIDGYNGLLVAPGAQPLEQALLRLAGDRPLLAVLATRAVEVASVFGKAQWQARWRGIVESALSSGSEPATIPFAPPAAATGPNADGDGRVSDALAARDVAVQLAQVLGEKLEAAQQAAARKQEEMQAAAARQQEEMQAAAARQQEEMQARIDALVEATAVAARRLSESEATAASLRLANEALSTKMHAAESSLAEQRARDEEQSRRLHHLTRTLASRDEAVAWLREEVRLRQFRMDERSASPKLLAADLARAVVNRSVGVKRFVKAAVPARLWNAAKRKTYVHQENALAPMVDAVIPTPAPAQVPIAGIAAPVEPAAPGVHRSYDVICLAIIEWTARYQRPHHMMDRFARDGHRVFYVEASRQPPAGQRYAQERVTDRITRVALAVDSVQDFYGHAMSAANLEAMSDALDALIEDQAIYTAVVFVHLPYWSPLAEVVRSKKGWRVVYDCMDEWADFPNIGADILAAEEELVARADAVTVTASLLETKWKARARRCLVVRNGVDFEFFSSRCKPNELLPDVPHPVIGFYGGLAEWVDYELIAACARARPTWQFVLAGDIFVKDLAGLETLPNVRLLGRRPYAEMPLLLYNFDVCLVPFKLNDVTHAVDPVKFYEYMSGGKPVVAVPLKEMAIYEDYAYFATGAQAFLASIETALRESDPSVWDRRLSLARANDWSMRHRQVVSEVEALHPLVSVIVVAFNNCALTKLCIESLLSNATWPRTEIIVVDNASTDETRAYLRYLLRNEASVRVILNDENRGFAAANNQGLAIAGGEYLVLLNNDTVVPRGWLEPLIAALQNPGIGLVGPVTNFVGNEARIEVEYAGIDGMAEFARKWMAAHAGEWFDISMLAMFCVALRRDTFDKVGPLDESYGIGMFEDDDYSRRIQEAGLRTVCTRASFVHHFGQASFKKLIEAGSYDVLWNRNREIYERKWGKWTQHKGISSGIADPVHASEAK